MRMCMATKTISIDIEAYERLRRARMHPKESFSTVIKRGHWEEKAATGQSWLNCMSATPLIDKATLVNLEKNQSNDHPPRNKWNS